MDPIKVEMSETAKVEEPQKPVVKEETKPSSEPKYVTLADLEKVNQAINNTREYNNRQLAGINEKLEKLAPKPISTGDPDLDAIAEKDWKQAVKILAKEVLEERETTRKVETEKQTIDRILEESKTKVMSKHPELSDPESSKAKEFLKVLEENPDFRTNPRGPLLAAYEMENRLKTSDTIESKEPKVPNQGKEARSRASSVPAGTSAGTKSTPTLSKADIDFCRLNDINPENYKKYKGMRETTV